MVDSANQIQDIEFRRPVSPLLDKDRLLQSIFRISTLLTTPSNLDEILSKILDELVESIGVDRGIIRLFDTSRRYLATKVVKNFNEHEVKKAFAIPLDIIKHDCIAAKVVRSGQLIAIENTATDPRITDTDRMLANIYDRGSIFCAPLKIGDDIIGTVVAWRQAETKFFPEEIDMLRTFASQISIVIYNARLFEKNAEKIRQLTMLHEAVSEMNRIGTESDRIASVLTINAVIITGVSKAMIYLTSEDVEQCLVYDEGELVTCRIADYRKKIERSMIRKAMETNMLLKKLPESPIPPSEMIFEGYPSEMAIPISIKDTVSGALYLAKQQGSFPDDQINILEILVNNAVTSFDNAIMHTMLSQEAISLKTEVDKLKEREIMLLGFHNILGKSEKMLNIFHIIEEIAGHNTNVLIQGASGTGKELLARAIHKQGNRISKPFVDVNCAAIPGTLLESELFGYEAGAFTDARKRKIGLFEYASGGTLFLDEIGEMSFPLQAKFLRVLEDGHVRRLGGTDNISIDVRFIFSTNRDLVQMVSEGTFREDLYYRISVVPIMVPSLRERGNDIIILAENFIEEFNNKFGKKVRGFSQEAKEILLRHPWPGNVRELKNIIERVMIMPHMADIIMPEHLPADIKGTEQQAINANVLKDLTPILSTAGLDFHIFTKKIAGQIKKNLITQALALSKGNKTNAAKLLGISRFKLMRELKSGE